MTLCFPYLVGTEVKPTSLARKLSQTATVCWDLYIGSTVTTAPHPNITAGASAQKTNWRPVALEWLTVRAFSYHSCILH